MSGTYKIGSGMYVEYAVKCRALLEKFKSVELRWIPRESNAYADWLSRTNESGEIRNLSQNQDVKQECLTQMVLV